MHFAGRIGPRERELEQVLHHDGVALHTGDLGNRHHPARAVGQARDVDDYVYGRGNLLAHRALRNRKARQQHHHLHAAQAFARAVGVDGGNRAVMAGRHRLQHVEDFGAAHLADDDPIGAHPQRVAHQLARGDLALALEVDGWVSEARAN